MRDDVPVRADLLSETVSTDWLVVGWFTPDYRPLAETIAADLIEHGAPFHLFAKPNLAKGWSTLAKPTVVLDAMDAYPGKSLVLMDVDCRVKGDIAPLTVIQGDVGLSLKARRAWVIWPPQRQMVVRAGSQVIVFRSTVGARSFAQEWQRLCSGGEYSNDETAMTQAHLLQRSGTTYSYLDRALQRVIQHDSAHDKQRRSRTIRGWLRALDHSYFRPRRHRR